MKRIYKIMRDKKGEGYIDAAVVVFCVMFVIALGVRIFPVFITKIQLDNFADELVREAEISGRVGSETTARQRTCLLYTSSRAETTEQLAPSGAGNKENSLLQFDVRIQSIRPGESIKGTASVNINGAFAIRGVKIIEGSNGLFVSMPSYKVGNEYKDICFPITQECRKQLHEAVIGAYEQAISQGQDTVAKHHGMQAPEGQPMEMAGM